MGRSDDSIARRKNKRSRRNQEDKNHVSTRVAAIIAAKKRRLSGKRRMCQGMCYSLPTLEDPFNDRYAKTDPLKKPKKTVHSKEKKMTNENKQSISKKRSSENTHTETGLQEQKKAKLGKASRQMIGLDLFPQDFPSKYLIVCLSTIQKILHHDSNIPSEEEKPFVVDSWGTEFWQSYTHGEDVLEASEDYARVEQIAWIASTAADTIARKEREGQSIGSPFLLYLVPSQENATKIRNICKPLKIRGIHTVSLHQGASIDHQIHGLKKCEPEFLVSTPDRLLELVTLNAIDLSGVSLLVIDGLKALSEGGYDDALQSIRQSITGDCQTVVFGDC